MAAGEAAFCISAQGMDKMSGPQTPTTSISSTALSNPGDGPVMATYGPKTLAFVRGEGCWLITNEGQRYLDCGSGIAVNVLGHAHPKLVAALTDQAGKLWHTSNLYEIEGQEALAAKLVGATFADVVFFCNSGAEACEGAIKTARRHHFVNGAPERHRIITFEGAFHGRTLAALSAAGNPKHLDGFGPEMPGFDHVPFGDSAAVEAAIGEETAAIMVEPIQGEGGIRVLPTETLTELRALCDDHGLLLILDEVQTGVGRTGHLFAHQASDVTPDIMAVAKGLGGGFPIGALLATNEAAKGMTAGTHGSTFGGNPLATAVAGTVLDIVTEPGFLQAVKDKALRFKQGLAAVKDTHAPLIEEVRGSGLMLGLKLTCDPADLVKAALNEQLLLVGAADNTVRILPPLTIDDGDISEALSRLDQALKSLST